MILTKNQAREIVTKILSYTKADAVQISVNGGTSSNLRFARNTVTTSGSAQNVSISIDVTFGKKTGSYSLNQFDDASLQKGVMKAEELAKLAPEDPEYMPPLDPQRYPNVNAYVETTANISPEFRADVAKQCIEKATADKLIAAGFIENGENFSMYANNKGLVAYHRQTNVEYSITARTEDGTGSGWGRAGHNNAAMFDGNSASERAIQKSRASAQPKAKEPGKYTVILEPQAV